MAESRTLCSKEQHLHQKSLSVTKAEAPKNKALTKKGQQNQTTTYHYLSSKNVEG